MMLAKMGCALLAGVAVAAVATPLPRDPLERECWLRHTRERTRVNLKTPTDVEFSNLRKGARLRSPFAVEFAVRGMGVVPAGKALAGTGHHHILVNTSLPVDIRAQIPFGDTHRHFGKGQTDTVLDLPPGKHRLRLLFADHEHRPYFVYSPEIEVTVTGPRTAAPVRIDPRDFDATCTAWYDDELARPRPPGESAGVLNLRDGEPVTSPFNVRLGVQGFGVCAAGQSAERTGHFHLDVRQAGAVVRAVDLSSGATQTNLALPNGVYQLQLRFIDGKTRRDLLPVTETTVVVTGQDRI